MPLRFVPVALVLALLPASAAAVEPAVTIRADFPGGNVRVEKNEGDTVRLAPDLRGGRPWFYWNFEAEAARAGRVTFLFGGAPMVGIRGPAVSRDGGHSWQWLGADQVRYAPAGAAPADRHESFTFDFKTAGEKVRFAVAIPYLQADLDAFLSKHAANSHLTRSTLTQTRTGRRSVDLIQVGKPGPGVRAVLFTARHHACESMASYVLEGFLREAVSDSPAAAEFRKRYVLYAVPIVDGDGVQAGDQGKNRLPHDHNRDYGREPIYPEVKAIQELADARGVELSLDFHCPFLRGDVHEVFYFDGLALPHVKDNVNELIAWIKEERPPAAGWPHDFLKKPPAVAPADGLPNSHYFAYRKGAVLAATLEVPYTQPACPLDADMARAYGASLLRAWLRMRFVGADADGTRGDADHAGLVKLRTAFQQTYRGKPAEAEQMVGAYLDAKASPVYRAEARNLLGVLRLHQRRFAEARDLGAAVIGDVSATTQQRATAMLNRTQAVSGDPTSAAADVEAVVAEALRFPYPASEYVSKVYEVAGDFYQRTEDFGRAVGYVRKQLAVAPLRDKGRLLNQVAALHDRLKQGEQAVAARQEAVTVLRPLLDPVPVGGHGAAMAADLFDALCGIPTATTEEKRAAAALVLDHKAAPAALKDRVRKALAAEKDTK